MPGKRQPGSPAEGRSLRDLVWVVPVLAAALGLLAVPTGSPSEIATATAVVAVLALTSMGVGRRINGLPTAAIWDRMASPWALIGAGAALAATGQVLSVLDANGASAAWFHHAFTLASAPLAIVGTSSLLRERVHERALEMVLEAFIGATTLGLLGWVGLIESGLANGSAAVLDELAPLVAGGLYLALVVVTARFAAVATTDVGAARCLLAAAGAMFVAEMLSLTTGLGGGDTAATHALAVIAALGFWGAASLYPPVGRIGGPVMLGPTRIGAIRLVLIVGASLLSPVFIVADLTLDLTVSLPTVAIGSALLSLLVVVYLIRVEWGRIEHRVEHDELTELPNRRLFHERLSHALSHARRHTNSKLAVMFLDLDRFKMVNDSLGHAAGNQLLQAVADRLKQALGPGHTVARLGGDEFAMLVPDVVDVSESTATAQKVLERFTEPFVVSKRKLYVTPSIGIAHYPIDGTDPESLLRNADTAMYQAKSRGRNTYQNYTFEMNAQASDRLALESALHAAIERDELRLLYQPKVNLATGQVVGAEVLVRWEHPELGLLQPAEFIPVAEETGMIVQVGEWVLERACEQSRMWEERSFPDLTIAVNLSARQFQLQRVEDMVARVLRNTGVNPARVELELTESLALDNVDVISATINDLRSLGVRCSIDDFGTGYSGLSYLSRFAINSLKIDKSFVQDISENGDEAPIVLAVIALAKGLNLEVIAEGVETQAQLHFLLRHGCDQMQGFLFSKPVPAEQFESLVMLERISPGPGRLSVVERPSLQVAGG